MPQNNNPNLISQIFMNKANEQFNKIKKLNFSTTPSIDDIKKLKAMSEHAEKYFKYALFTGCDNAAYELIQLYDFIFIKDSGSQSHDLEKKIFHDDLVLLGPKFGITECQQMDLIFNPPTTNESEINISYDAICRTREYFSNKKLVDNPETNDEIINYYLKSFEAISEKQHVNNNYNPDDGWSYPTHTHWENGNKVCLYEVDGQTFEVTLVGNE
ncbi:hypothetical protein A3306_06365 [Rickettsia bellii]|uniref:Uncharacterized protein n=3 Tax=Rickettsia bellii TaxID=33990 RepID=Q1RIF0_RICBR|nr:hypothetical protein [Rickettsia bellii]ABE04864.1 unknown [Rickettsia bellii RML369-C]ABV79339.1 hypothetical protein A1I_05030 [Rickettsia bellii OSU 85-389]ARD86751.1 hypothetical protein A3306_06365 [Rickettsia bellii]KJV89559.1 hypothetical protein RBEAN4_0538 [Rickettsia bellii str. RML An4]KJV92050.1 hypothetical protein RBEMOGI_0668 [Rickettsia bellii str. RML Mogi]